MSEQFEKLKAAVNAIGMVVSEDGSILAPC